MNLERPGVLAVRAVNQYRRRDIVPYLALRYYLGNAATRNDRWAQRAATELLMTRSAPTYYHAHHFKDVASDGRIEHRNVYLPGANESLAEAALLDQCANRPEVFENPKCVYSYPLASGDDRRGIFRPYFEGFRARHNAIAEACDQWPRGVVRYADIRRFYPSIDARTALSSWQNYAALADLPAFYRDLGDRLLRDYSAISPEGKGVLTGPMFCHLLGNLILRKLDEHLGKREDVRYFRYVDDIVLVGEAPRVKAALGTIKSLLVDVGLKLHSDSAAKSLEVSTSEWSQGRHDFAERPGRVSWRSFIADLKRLLVYKPEALEELQDRFLQEGLRVPVLDYGEVAREASYLSSFGEWIRQGAWALKKTHATSVLDLLERAKKLRILYQSEFEDLVDNFDKRRGYSRKRGIPKLRFYASRLIYLARDEDLERFARLATEVNELRLQSDVMSAVCSGNIDRLIRLGTNAAQAAAQPLRAVGRPARTTLKDLTREEWQALSIFIAVR